MFQFAHRHSVQFFDLARDPVSDGYSHLFCIAAHDGTRLTYI